MHTNPYESPKYLVSEQEGIIWPRRAPRDGYDWLYAAVVIAISIPAGLAPLWGIEIAPFRIEVKLILLVGYALVLLLVGLTGYLHGIQRLTLRENGIELHRTWGSPKFVEWQAIRSVRKMSRWHMLWASWRWAQICPQCFSIHEYYRIDWQEGYFYFPPRDVENFVETIQQRIALNQRIDSRKPL